MACGGSTAYAADASRMGVRQLPGDAERHVQSAGEVVFITWYQGLPGRRDHVRHITALDLDDTAYIRDVCSAEIRPQQPNLFKSEAVTVTEGTLAEAGSFAAEGIAVGVHAAAVKTLLKEGAGAGIVGSAVNGFDSHNRAKRNHEGQCMVNYLNDAVRVGDKAGGIHYIIDQDSIEGQGLSTSDKSGSTSPPGPADVTNEQMAPTRR